MTELCFLVVFDVWVHGFEFQVVHSYKKSTPIRGFNVHFIRNESYEPSCVLHTVIRNAQYNLQQLSWLFGGYRMAAVS